MASLTHAMREYISRMIALPGMKVLVVDQETLTYVSLVMSQSEIIAQNVLLTQRIDRIEPKLNAPGEEEKQNVGHLVAVCFLRPTDHNVEAVRRMLQNPEFREYHLFFSNFLSRERLKSIADADEYELVRQVHEYFGDYLPVHKNLGHLGLPLSRPLSQDAAYWLSPERRLFDRSKLGLLSLLLSLKTKPEIRYDKASPLARNLAIEVNRTIKAEAELFMFRDRGQSLLLILDRKEDPVTPLLKQWTYAAMVHELVGIEDNRADLAKARKQLHSSPFDSPVAAAAAAPGGKDKDVLDEVLFDAEIDPFFAKSMYLNFGDLGGSVKNLVAEYQRKTNSNRQLDSIEDIQRFVDAYPEFKKQSHTVSKHVTVMTLLGEIVEKLQLMKVSELEQQIACDNNHAAHLESLLRIMDDRVVHFEEKLRLVCLFTLRYETTSRHIPTLRDLLRDWARRSETPELAASRLARVRVVDELLAYAGSQQRGGNLFGQRDGVLAKAQKLFAPLKGVENIFIRHRPLVHSTLHALLKGRLNAQNFPSLSEVGGGGKEVKERYKTIIVFIAGGVTYAEDNAIQQLNEEFGNAGVQIVLAGSTMHNSTSFINHVLDVQDQDKLDQVDQRQDELSRLLM